MLLAAGLLAGPAPATERAAAVAPAADSVLVWVYFSDKGVPPGGAARALARARASLSERSLRRRALRGRIVREDPSDIPVYEPYVQDLLGAGLRVRHRSRWLNAVSGWAEIAALHRITALPFVDRTEAVVHAPLSRRVVVEPGPPPRAQSASFDSPRAAPSQGALPGPAFYGDSYAQSAQHQVPQMHAEGLTGAGVLVGILDTGFITSHRAFLGLDVVGEFDAVNNDSTVANEPGDPPTQQNHGTYVWSALAANWVGRLVGPAYGASFLLAKTEVVGSETQVEEDNWIAAIEWMEARGVDVTNTSLGYYDWYSYSDMDGDTSPMTIAADRAAALGVVMVTSAGNEGSLPPPLSPTAPNTGYWIGAPADGDSVIAAGGVLSNGTRWPETSHGPTFDGRIKPDIMALGSLVACAIPGPGDSTLGSVSGTSLASPLVTAAAVLLLEAHPEWTPMQVREAIRETGDRSFNALAGQPDNDYGWGSLRGADALRHGEAPPVGAAGVGLYNYPNPFQDDTVFVCRVPSAGIGHLRIFTATGAAVREIEVQTAYETTISIVWDGTNDSLNAVAPGVYMAVLEFEGGRARTRVLRVPPLPQ